MKFATLTSACHANHADVLYINYYGRFGIWLEGFDGRSFLPRALLSVVNRLRHVIPFESRLFSPYIICIARKREKP
jgi:hypothetical protein